MQFVGPQLPICFTSEKRHNWSAYTILHQSDASDFDGGSLERLDDLVVSRRHTFLESSHSPPQLAEGGILQQISVWFSRTEAYHG
jgi:hypothetical protein